MTNNFLVKYKNNEEHQTYIKSVKKLNISKKNEYLSDDEVGEILTLYYGEDANSYNFEKHLKDVLRKYKAFKNEFPTLKDINRKEINEIKDIMKKHRCLKIFLFHLLCNRIKADNTLNLYGVYNKVEELLEEGQISKIKEACISYKYSLTKTYMAVMSFIIRIIIIKNKELEKIQLQDIYDIYRSKQDPANAVFNVLKYLGYINTNEQYDINYRKRINNNKAQIKLMVNEEEYIRIYNKYVDEVNRQEDTEGNKVLALRTVKLFFNWLSEKYGCINFYEMDHKLAEEFIMYLKNYKTESTMKIYSVKSFKTMLSQFNKFLRFLCQKDLVNAKFIKENNNKAGTYFVNEPVELFKDIVPGEDRKLVEKIIMEFAGYPVLSFLPDMLRLMYYCGMRPIELTNLKLNCIKGSENNPSLHIHKTKNTEERYIPLVKEAYEIVKKYQKLNKQSLAIYSKYDNLNIQRLFCYRNKIVNANTLNRVFSKLQIENNLINADSKPKYVLYILRKLRITMWIENGLNLEEICLLAGHRDVESQNYYYVGKEFMQENGLKVYVQLYKKFIDDVGIMRVNSTENNSSNQDFFNELENTVMEIENKSIFNIATKMAYKEYPEMFFPLMNGLCAGTYEEGENFNCKAMELPCFECNDLIGANSYKSVIDNYLKSIYKSRKQHSKNGLYGLVDREDSIIERLFKFYRKTFKLNDEEVKEKFKIIENESIRKGRR